MCRGRALRWRWLLEMQDLCKVWKRCECALLHSSGPRARQGLHSRHGFWPPIKKGEVKRKPDTLHTAWITMYTPDAAARRRCTATRCDGEPCKAWALWADPFQRCVRHARGGRGKQLTNRERIALNQEKTKYTPCTCETYPFPHRPCAGWCNWPNPPIVRVTFNDGDRHANTPAERRAWYRWGKRWTIKPKRQS